MKANSGTLWLTYSNVVLVLALFLALATFSGCASIPLSSGQKAKIAKMEGLMESSGASAVTPTTNESVPTKCWGTITPGFVELPERPATGLRGRLLIHPTSTEMMFTIELDEGAIEFGD